MKLENCQTSTTKQKGFELENVQVKNLTDSTYYVKSFQ